MATDLIVSYDGSDNDEDALALGDMLAGTGASLALAYVRHAREWDARREEIAQHDAEHLLEVGAHGLNAPDAARHVVLNPSTPTGLAELAAQEGAQIIVFGSEYRTSPGRAEPGTSAQALIEGGPVAIAVAAAGLRTERNGGIRRIAIAPPSGVDEAAAATAAHLADRLDAEIVEPGGDADLTIVGSQPGGADGRINLGGAARAALNATRGSVLVLPTGVAPQI
jgi:nucleotide-binding universal stress UspA family protein